MHDCNRKSPANVQTSSFSGKNLEAKAPRNRSHSNAALDSSRQISLSNSQEINQKRTEIPDTIKKAVSDLTSPPLSSLPSAQAMSDNGRHNTPGMSQSGRNYTNHSNAVLPPSQGNVVPSNVAGFQQNV